MDRKIEAQDLTEAAASQKHRPMLVCQQLDYGIQLGRLDVGHRRLQLADESRQGRVRHRYRRIEKGRERLRSQDQPKNSFHF